MGVGYSAYEGLQRLRGGDPVLFAEDACLIVRRPAMSCGLCKEACPAGVLSGNRWTVALESDGCIGCGICAAACPTGAIRVEGFTPAEHIAEKQPDRIAIECRRVPAAFREPDAVTIPCLGGLTIPDLLDLAAASDAPVALQDRGWCEECPVSGCAEPWQASLDGAKHILNRLDPQYGTRLAVDDRPTPLEAAEPAMAALRPEVQLDRRDFFRRMADRPATHDARESKRVVFGRGAVRPIQRQHILAAAEALAGTAVANLMPVIDIGDACNLHGICAAICPTEALQKVASGDGSLAIEFDARDCIACGECQRACPSKALSLWAEGGRQGGEYPVTLVARRSRSCDGCGAVFAPAGGDAGNLCAVCSRSIDVMRDWSDTLSKRQLTS